MQYKAANPETTKEKGWIMPQRFRVPKCDASWPEQARGKKLGAIVGNIRSGKYYKEHRVAVEALGIVIYG